MKIVVTGPTGAVGYALIEKCIEKGIEVLAICHKGSYRTDLLPKSPNVRLEYVDLEEYKTASLHGEYDVFFHLAWKATTGMGRNDMGAQYANIGYSLDAVQLAKQLGCHTFIGAGSQAEYGRAEGRLSSATPTFPENGYGIAKLCAGQMTRILCEQLGMKHIWTRILSVYGPYDGMQSLVSTVICKVLAGEKPSLTKGEQKWDYLYSGDAADALLLMGEKGQHGKIYPLGNGEVKSLSEYICIIRDLINKDIPLGFGEIPYSPKQVMHLQADITMLMHDTGFIPRVSFEEGIQRTIDWVRKQERSNYV